MFNRSQVKLGLTGAVLLIIIGSFTACADLPTAASSDEQDNCIMIDGVISCAPG